MRKFLLFALAATLVFSFATQVIAENSASTSSGTAYYENQVYVTAYNNSGADITSRSVVVLDTSATTGTTLGAYITTTTTADDYRVFGVTRDDISDGTSGLVIVRGPAIVTYDDSGASTPSLSAIYSTSTTAGEATTYSTSDGTTGGQLGYVISVTPDDGADGGADLHWIWVDPRVHD